MQMQHQVLHLYVAVAVAAFEFVGAVMATISFKLLSQLRGIVSIHILRKVFLNLKILTFL